MAVYVMLTVDLDQHVTSRAREHFNQALAKDNWNKLHLTTTWYAQFKDNIDPGDAIDETKREVHAAAVSAGIARYEAAAEVGASRPVVW